MEKQQKEVFFETKELTKKFGDVTAVNHVSMTIRTGEIRGLIGENGSGKSTISSMISAIHTVRCSCMGSRIIRRIREMPEKAALP